MDSLNAEVALGTVTTVDEGVQWIGWTYLFVRMRKNPMVYGLTLEDLQNDPWLGSKRHTLIVTAAKKLRSIGMVLFDEDLGTLVPTEVGRIASRYYIKHASIEVFNQSLRPKMSEADVSPTTHHSCIPGLQQLNAYSTRLLTSIVNITSGTRDDQ